MKYSRQENTEVCDIGNERRGWIGAKLNKY